MLNPYKSKLSPRPHNTSMDRTTTAARGVLLEVGKLAPTGLTWA